MYILTAADATATRLARAWLWLGIIALAGSGLLAILLALSRTPGVQDFLPGGDFFRAALIVHVDLSVMVWFLAFAAVLWSLGGNECWALGGWLGVWLCAGGLAVLVLSPFLPNARPLLNNYIPILEQPFFFAGLLACGAGFTVAMVRAVATSLPSSTEPARVAAWLAALTGVIAVVTTALTWAWAPGYLSGQAYFEMLFWGGGHVLQFQHSLLLGLAWFWLAAEIGQPPRIGPRTATLLFVLAALPVAATPLILAAGPIASAQYIAYFAQMMTLGHPLMLPLGIVALLALWRGRAVASPAKSAFAASFLLFAVGGVLGYLIQGVNVVIPAHYHGAIVGVTLAFMGLTYVLLPRLGFGEAGGRMARLQPYVYGGGQLLHVLGLAWSGGYGVQRKVAGAEQLLVSLPQKVGMGLMGLGGLIAVIGGVMFVVVCLRAMLNHRQR